MPISTDNMGPSMLPQGVNSDGTPSLSSPAVIDPPASFGQGGTPKLSTAFQGLLTETSAVMQETQRAMREMTMLTQRLSAMVGGTGHSGGPVMSIEPHGPLSDAVARAHSGLAYGRGLGMPLVIGATGYAGGIQLPGGGSSQIGMSAATAGFQPVPATNTTATGVVPPGGIKTDAGPNTQGQTIQPSQPAIRPEDAHTIEEKQKHIQEVQGLQESFQQGHSIQGVATRIKTWAQGTSGEGGNALGRSKLLFGSEAEKGAGGIIGRAAGGSSIIDSVAGGVAGDSAVAGLGVAGLVVGGLDALYHFGGNWLAGQRAQNATFQSQVGGSNLGGLAYRAHQTGFEASTWGTFTAGQADQIFQGVLGTGLRGGGLTNGLNFTTQNYNNMGMSPQESIKFLQQAVQAGATSFQLLGNTLQNVTDTASAASVNTENARQTFAGLFQTMLGQGMTTNGAAVAAGAQANVISGLGLTGEGVKTLPTGSIAMQAAMLGMTPGEYQAQIMGPNGALVKAHGEQQVVNRLMGSLPTGGAAALARTDLHKDHGNISSGDVNSVMQDVYRSTGMDSTTLMALARGWGYTGTEQGLGTYFANTLANNPNANLSTQARNLQAKDAATAAAQKKQAADAAAAAKAKELQVAGQAFDERNDIEFGTWRMVYGPDMSKWTKSLQPMVKQYEHYNPGLPASMTGANDHHTGPPHPAKNNRTRNSNRHEGSPQGQGQNREPGSSGGQIKHVVTMDSKMIGLFKLVTQGLPTNAMGTMGNPQSPVKLGN